LNKKYLSYLIKIKNVSTCGKKFLLLLIFAKKHNGKPEEELDYGL